MQPLPSSRDHPRAWVSARHGRKLILLLAALAGLATAAPPARPADSSKAPRQPQPFVVGLSPYLDRSVKDEVFRGLVQLLVEKLPLNTTLTVYDAFHLRQIAHASLPNLRVFTSAKTRAHQFALALQDIRQFLATEHSKPAHESLTFDSAIKLPQLYDFLVENLEQTNEPVTVLLLGTPLYHDAKEPAFSMANGYFPSDGHLQASRDQTVYGMRPRAGPSPRFTFHWACFGDPWLNDLHQEKVTRFWTLFLQARGAQLATFVSDLPTALQAFGRGATAGASPSQWTLDPHATKVEMLRVARDVDHTDWITRDTVPEAAQQPPDTLIGPMKIGIRWAHQADLDLYATPRAGADTLFFDHVRSPEGYYYKDHRSSPGREYEFIEFESPVDVRQITAKVNLYRGSCPGGAHGEVRIEFDGRIYSSAFRIAAENGNLGRRGPRQGEYWTSIAIQEVLNINLTN